MKIGLLSDTHTKFKRAKKVIDLLVENGAEYLIHAGDVCQVETLEYMKETKLPYVCVYGNNDANIVPFHNKFNLVQEPHLFKIKNETVKLMHLPYYMNPETSITVFGHTHQFECSYKGNSLFINPGEACARNKPLSECAMIDVSKKQFDVEYFSRALKTKEWKRETFSFERD